MIADPSPAEGSSVSGGDGSAFHWLLAFVSPHRWRLAGILALSLLATALGLAQPYITKFLVDDGLIAGRMDTVIALCALMLGIGLLATLIGVANRWHYVDVSARILFALREAVYRHLQRLSPSYYARTRGGDLIARLDGDVAEVQRFAVDSLLASVNGVIALAGALALMASLSWKLSLLALVLLPAEVLFLRGMRRRIEARTRTVRERASDITAFLVDTLPAMKFIQSVGAEAREAGRLGGLQDAFRTDMLRLQMTNFVAGAVPSLMVSVTTALVFITGGYMMVAGTLTLGTLLAFTIYLARATGPVQTLLGIYVAVRRARVSLDRVMEITTVKPAVEPPARPVALPADGPGALVLEGVSFGYGAGGPAVLDRIDAVIPAGTRVGVIGDSGVGKTTVIDLLQRHFDPDAGRILLDGVDLRDLDPVALRRAVAVVAQDTVLFAGSIADNIRYAAPDAGEDAVRHAAELAQVDAFASELPEGYHSDIGARGTALSGGQRQRIAIARAILQEPRVLILDEATSEIDDETEALISQAIDRLFAGRTRIVISHRAETHAGADALYELSEGRLIPREPAMLERALP